MSKEDVLARVEADLAERDLGKARDRLNTMVFQYPDDLDLRARLATVYDALGLPAMAGRFWFFEEARDGARGRAIAAFERSCRSNPLHMLAALKFRGDRDQMPSHARDRLNALEEAVPEKDRFKPSTDEPSAKALIAGVIVVALIFVGLAVTGFVSIVRWTYQAIR